MRKPLAITIGNMERRGGENAHKSPTFGEQKRDKNEIIGILERIQYTLRNNQHKAQESRQLYNGCSMDKVRPEIHCEISRSAG